MSTQETRLYEVEVSMSVTMYVIADNRKGAEEIAEEDCGEAFLDVDARIDYVHEVDCIERIPKRVHNEHCYGEDMTISQFFTQEEEGEPVITQAELEAAGQLKLIDPR